MNQQRNGNETAMNQQRVSNESAMKSANEGVIERKNNVVLLSGDDFRISFVRERESNQITFWEMKEITRTSLEEKRAITQNKDQVVRMASEKTSLRII